MKREEAIKLLNDIHNQCCDTANILCTSDADKRCDALQLAITVLQNQPEPYKESKPHKQTNADRIRNMTDEELSETGMCPDIFSGNWTCFYKRDCKECVLAWLQKESEE